MSTRQSTPRSEYAKKLLDPRWQKLRLECLEANGWQCVCCGAGLGDAKTLHVHHRQYFKGREPWEYDQEQLEPLCVDCHADRHDAPDELLNVCSYIGDATPIRRSDVLSLLVGFIGHPRFQSTAPDPDLFLLGCIAACTPVCGKDALTTEELIAILEKAKSGREAWLQHLRSFISPEPERRVA